MDLSASDSLSDVLKALDCSWMIRALLDYIPVEQTIDQTDAVLSIQISSWLYSDLMTLRLDGEPTLIQGAPSQIDLDYPSDKYV